MALIDDKMVVTLGSRNVAHWRRELQDAGLRVGQVVEVTPSQLPKTAKNRVTALCDACGKRVTLTYSKYFHPYNAAFLSRYFLFPKKCLYLY